MYCLCKGKKRRMDKRTGGHVGENECLAEAGRTIIGVDFVRKTCVVEMTLTHDLAKLLTMRFFSLSSL